LPIHAYQEDGGMVVAHGCHNLRDLAFYHVLRRDDGI
jgi:hypothetical protein